ncbi:hypothetical protein CPAST_c34630 [Clostridium pasteurianum DSM 525 = ATCC 6013]|uniref:Uncharacterized protein n=1 Tax=Clostridium pasteurianum DSM 525 = ATCC 6013 TaxID=1262449 RepID=A0A0H3J7S3_CLOPA|nr:hypothetical protein [Clostridium pasteurianum]AJA49524.1 hypothetical protein CPAST_c34630 [Clostridium pasteurianum DSM 525 = ATCC 6013]AJA53512.1 hypothetical protein CLPA_c34630 [Clostridium pasteurianum DSM 525 = ATCC 6013]AOZ76684.1 hypothetical protein AQ983_16820 [Clostridium pasteurianum DSM 525 = ATCC 6013]AOZ80481.1 hypothetical protein AQ984_16815 [Clostridium pasteurianum]ELP58958.1 hypothetical protein F502_12556 [Clostridium pasteurianum DSM 525 = ATCC 6013]
MALQMQYTANSGVVAQNAYIYIQSLCEMNRESLSVQLAIYYTKENKINNNVPIFSAVYTFKPDVSDTAQNYRKQAYIFLKTLDIFASAINVLEEGQPA